MPTRTALLQTLARPVNARVLALRDSPRWGPRVRKHLAVVTYAGRRSGRSFSTPVGYRRDGDTVTIRVMLPESKRWWRNFLGEGRPIELDLVEGPRTGHAVAHRDARGRVTVTAQLDGSDS